MKILLVGNYPYKYQESMQRFANLLEELLRQKGNQVCLLRPSPILGRLNPGSTGLGKWLGYFDRFLLFPFILRKKTAWADVVHICDHVNAIYVPCLNDVPNVITCHDLIAIRSALGDIPEYTPRWSGRVFQRWILKNLVKSKYIVCVSNRTREELHHLTSLPSTRIVVVQNALNYPYRPMAQYEAWNRLKRLGVDLEKPFLIHVGGNQWNKNRMGVLRIFNALNRFPGYENYHLVMVGKLWTRLMRDYVKQNNLYNKVFELTNVNNEDLRALYSSAEAMIFPSLYEGFGWPIIESQACGCPVFTSNRPPMIEVGGDGAVYFDPTNEKNAASIIANSLLDRSELVESSLQNSHRFSRQNMVEGYLKAYRTELLNFRGYDRHAK